MNDETQGGALAAPQVPPAAGVAAPPAGLNHSPAINELAGALAKAQGVMKNALKDSDNPFFKSKYADLASVAEACMGPLSQNGIAVIQGPETETNGNITVTTMLCHSSGQWVSSSLTMKPVKTDPQGMGSCITYARRYALASMCGVAPEDDDGNAASGKSAPIADKSPNAAWRQSTSKDIEGKTNQQVLDKAAQNRAAAEKAYVRKPTSDIPF